MWLSPVSLLNLLPHRTPLDRSESRIFQCKSGRLGELGAVKEYGTTGSHKAESEGPFKGLNIKGKKSFDVERKSRRLGYSALTTVKDHLAGQ